MAFSRAPRHLFQLLPNGKAESADPRIRFDHLWMFVINGVERKRARKRGRHTYYLSTLFPFSPFLVQRYLFRWPFPLPILLLVINLIPIFSPFVSTRVFNSFLFFRVEKQKKRRREKQVQHRCSIQWINMSIQPISPWIYMNVTRNLTKFIWHFTKDSLWRWRWSKDGQFARSMARALTEWSRVISYNTRGDFIIETSWNNISRHRNFANLILPPSRCVISSYDSQCRRIIIRIVQRKHCTSHPRTRKINVRKFIPTVS